jgi:hypothetical protein
MSTEPLLPSYASATWQPATQDFAPPTASVIHRWSFVIFANAAVFSTIWASKGRDISDWVSYGCLFRPSFSSGSNF